MTSKDYQDGKLVILSKAFDNRAKILNFIYFVVFTFSGVAFLILFFSATSITLGLVAFSILVAAIYSFIGYKFLNKCLQTEKLFITHTKLVIERKGFLNTKINSYSIANISNLRHLKLPEVSKHPLAGDNFDYLGFETEQKVINEMHGDNRIAFDYGNKTITFGENLYSWDFDEINRLISEVTGNFQLTTGHKEAFD